MDPLASKYPGMSPYNYCLNNPLRLIDPNGLDVWIDEEYGYLDDPNVSEEGLSEVKDKKERRRWEFILFYRAHKQEMLNMFGTIHQGSKVVAELEKGEKAEAPYADLYFAFRTPKDGASGGVRFRRAGTSDEYEDGNSLYDYDTKANGLTLKNLDLRVEHNPTAASNKNYDLNVLTEEWMHVEIIYNNVKEQGIIPRAGFQYPYERDKSTQHGQIYDKYKNGE